MAQKLLLQPYKFPTIIPFPSTPTVDLENPIVKVTGATYQIGTIEETGWYLCTAVAEDGTKGSGTALGGARGVSFYPAYLYAGTQYIVWGASSLLTGYPWPSGTGANASSYGGAGVLGGGGGTGPGRSGGGGGGAGGNGGYGQYKSGNGGGGAGVIAGLNLYQPTMTETWSDGDFSVDTVECMILAGGGGGGAGDENASRSGGGGGGAWGNGGDGYTYSGGTGPGGTEFGAGAKGEHYGSGASGAWCIRNYTTSTFQSGTSPGGLDFGYNLLIVENTYGNLAYWGAFGNGIYRIT